MTVSWIKLFLNLLDCFLQFETLILTQSALIFLFIFFRLFFEAICYSFIFLGLFVLIHFSQTILSFLQSRFFSFPSFNEVSLTVFSLLASSLFPASPFAQSLSSLAYLPFIFKLFHNWLHKVVTFYLASPKRFKRDD